MSALHSASNIFIDFKNAIANTDLFVCSNFYKSTLSVQNRLKDHPLHGFIEIIDNLGEDYIVNFTNTKKTYNPLKEIVDDKMLSDHEKVDELCDGIYDNILYFNYTSIDTNDFQYTNLADALLNLAKDKQLEHVYIYVEEITHAIQQSLMNRFNNLDKFLLVTGDKAKFIKDVPCDMYIFDSVMDIELLPTVLNPNDETKKDVLFLNSTFNLGMWDDYFKDNDGTHTSVSERFNINPSIVSVITN